MNNFDFNRYISFVDEISNDMNYPNSIRHLLYVVVPAFIINYGIENERLILECFRKTKIYLSNNIPDNNVILIENYIKMIHIIHINLLL